MSLYLINKCLGAVKESVDHYIIGIVPADLGKWGILVKLTSIGNN